MGKTNKISNPTFSKRPQKKIEVSDTESDTSSEKETKTPILKFGEHIKFEPQDSESSKTDSEDEKTVFTQNVKNAPSSNEAEEKKSSIKKKLHSKQSMQWENELPEIDFEKDSNPNNFQTNKYLLNKSADTQRTLKFSKQVNPIAQSSDDSSSSSSVYETLKNAFLGQQEVHSSTKLSIKKSNKASANDSSTENSSDNDKKSLRNSSVHEKKTLNVQDTSKQKTKSVKSIKQIPEKHVTGLIMEEPKQKIKKKSKSSLTRNDDNLKSRDKRDSRGKYVNYISI